MNVDDETLLSAYLDGELKPGERVLVESVLLESPRLAERLRELAGVRGLLRSLPRPTSEGDLTQVIVGRIEELPSTRLRRGWVRIPLRVRVASAGSLTAAAALLMAFLLPLPGTDTGEPMRGVVSGPPAAGRLADSDTGWGTTTGPGSAIDVAAQPSLPELASEEREAAVAGLTWSGGGEGAGIAAAKSTELEAIQAMLEEPEPRRLVLVVDALTDDLVTQVEGAILRTARRNPARGGFRVDQGQAAGQGLPGEAVIFALVMDNTEAIDLQRRLREAFPESPKTAIENAPAEMVAELRWTEAATLADDTAIRRREPVAADIAPLPDDVSAPTRLATRSEAEEGAPSVAREPSAPPAAGHRTRTEAERGSPGPAPEDGGEHLGVDRPRLYLVCVSARGASALPPM